MTTKLLAVDSAVNEYRSQKDKNSEVGAQIPIFAVFFGA